MKDALVALGMGGPDSIEAIEPFLANLFSDREVIDFHMGDALQHFIACRIATRRAKKVAPHYEKLGGGSPQLRLTEMFLKKLAVKYVEKTGIELDTYPAMCYWHPLIKHAVIKLTAMDRLHQYRRIIIFPMYPQYSVTTTGTCFRRFDRAIRYTPTRAPLVRFNSYHMHQPYLDVLAERVCTAASKIGVQVPNVHLLFSAHSLPRAVVDHGDPYREQIFEQCTKLAAMIQPGSYSIAYQSRHGRKTWLSPSIKDELASLVEEGVKDVVVLAVSFINDHIETLIELDEELLGEARNMGLNIVRAETPNDADDFAAAIADLISEIY